MREKPCVSAVYWFSEKEIVKNMTIFRVQNRLKRNMSGREGNRTSDGAFT